MCRSRLYHNGNKSIEFTNLAIRTANSISHVGGQMFSTFFGGSDSSWATPRTQYTYYRDMAMFASDEPWVANTPDDGSGSDSGINGSNGSSGGSNGTGSNSKTGAATSKWITGQSSKVGMLTTVVMGLALIL